MSETKRDSFRTATHIALSTSDNQTRAIDNFESSAVILNVFSLSENDGALFRHEFFRVLLILIILAPFFAILSLLHILLLGRYPYFYAVGCMLLGCCLMMGFQRRNVNLKQKTGIIFGNDHFFLLRGIIQAWQKKHNLIYVQHGLIGPRFPNPNCFDEIYFDSEYSRSRYDFNISQSKIKKSHKSRFAEPEKPFKPMPIENSSVCIGLAFQDPSYAKHFVSKNLDKIQSLRGVSIRLHPRLRGNTILNDTYPDLDVHFGNERPLSEFFQSTDLLVSEASSLLIDSMVYGTPCVQLDAGRMGDYYGLAAQAFIPSIEDDDLGKILDMARHFNFTRAFARFGLGK